mgnify:CR=1 FL=1
MRLRKFADAIETLRVLDEALNEGRAQPAHVRRTMATMQSFSRRLKRGRVEVLGVDWAAWRFHPGDVALRFILDRYRQSGITVLRRLRDE